MFDREIAGLSRAGLLRGVLSRASAQGPVIFIGRKRYINFSSNDYLGLSFHPELACAASRALERYGTGAGASRLLAGGTLLHDKLEELIAAWKETDSAIVFNSGYAANTGVIPSIAGGHDVIFSDELNHASIIDGCRLSSARTVVYRHKDIPHLKRLLKRENGRRKIIITDTVFSMDGDIAPITELHDLCRSVNLSRITRHSALLYLDDAHGTGVLGQGKGALAHFGLQPAPWIIQMGTFSKAMGSFGAFATGNKGIIQWISNTARSYLFSTALPPSVIAATIAAVRMISKEPLLIHRLWSSRDMLMQALEKMGYEETGSETPVIPLRVASVQEALGMSQFLFEQGIYAPAIRPPTVREPRVRIVVSAAHEERHLNRLITALGKWRNRKLNSGN